MKRSIILLLLLVVGLLALVGYFFFVKNTGAPVAVVPGQEGATLGEPAFEWVYESSSGDEIPSTKISLAARYPGGSVQKKDIDTIAGGCNEYEEADTDAYKNSTMIICYYAGLGHYYKVVEVGGEYLVQRKVFEEASPEYNPPPEQFETIVRF